METETIHKAETTDLLPKLTPAEAAETLLPDFKIIAKRLWRTEERVIREELVQEMCLACMALGKPATRGYFVAAAISSAINYLVREKRHERLTFMTKEDLSQLLDKRFIHSPDPADGNLDPKPKSIPLPTHPVFRFLSQAV